MTGKFFRNVLDKLIYGTWGAEPTDRYRKVRYKRIWLSAALITSIVSITPLIVMTWFNYTQYRKTFYEEMVHPIKLLVATGKRSLEYSLEERLNALHYIVMANSAEQLSNDDNITRIKNNLDKSFKHFSDLSLIDYSGNVVSYAGPDVLRDKLRNVNYKNDDWFEKVLHEGLYISDVFPGHRDYPHFVIALRTKSESGYTYILRASLGMDILDNQVPDFQKTDPTDAFIINGRGVLQIGDKKGMMPLEDSGIDPPPYSDDVSIIKNRDKSGVLKIIGYAYIENSPFIFVMSKRMPDLMGKWLSLRSSIIVFLLSSILVILILIMGVSSVLVSRIREADEKHEKALHQVEYSAKMASIGRLAAGVAHEINNPLAIINEKAGLLHDVVSLTDDFPKKDKSLKIIDSILNSVERGSKITHRLLGFARHIDVQTEMIDVPKLIGEVMSFLEKEAEFRSIEIGTFFEDNLPQIESDRGQLQQVFLNIINNAMEAVKKDGRVGVLVEQRKKDAITVVISDSGPGIDREDLDHIFEPFFTTKSKGTGLGLAITYGIVRKLRGDIEVESEKGIGTNFIITLPLKRSGNMEQGLDQ